MRRSELPREGGSSETDYEKCRGAARYHVIVPGHDVPDIETVIEQHEGWAIVEDRSPELADTLEAVPVDTGHARVACRQSAILTEKLESDPRRLRENLDELFILLRDADPRVRRSILRMFGELVAKWQERQLGTPISVVVEFQSDAVRMTLGNSRTPLMPAAWEGLISPVVLDYVDSSGGRSRQGRKRLV